MWMVKLKILNDFSIEYDKRKKMPADALMAICGFLAAGLIIAGAVFLVTGGIFSFGKNMPAFLNKIILRLMLKEPVIHTFFEDDDKLSLAYIAALFFGAALIIWVLAIAFVKKKRLGIMVLCFVLTFSVLTGLLYPLKVTKSMDYRVKERMNSAKEAIEAVRFNKGEPVCEGDFTAKAGLGLTDDAALNIKLQNPQPYYLRGFVGERYNGIGWSGQDTAVLVEYNDVFLKLRDRGFDGRTMMADISELVSIGSEKQKIEIENIGCNKKYLYLPYETYVLENKSIDYIGDSCYISESPKKGEKYSFNAAPYSVNTVTSMRKKLVDKQAETSCADFLKNEYNYRVFCRENYTDLPDGAVENIAKFLEISDAPGREKLLSPAEIKKIILESTRDFKYDENIVYSAENGDFIADFLKNKRGYSRHFSTLAAAIFRYYGVPARFAEGYLLTDKDVEKKEPDEVIELTQSAYHTWMEYYEDGIGWVPFEATPEYIGIMKSDSNISSSNVSGSRDRVERTKPEKQKHNLLINREGEINKAASIILILLIILAVYFLFKLIKILRGSLHRGHSYSHRDMSSDDYKRAIFAVMYHIKKVEKKLRLDRELLTEAIEIYEEAKYSNHEITVRKRDKMRELYDNLKKAEKAK